MAYFVLNPLSQCSQSGGVETSQNPPMVYDKTLGTPTAQNIVPPFTNLPAHIDEINGSGPAYVWNYNNQTWN